MGVCVQVVSFPGLWKYCGQDQGRGPGQACLPSRGAPGAAVRTFVSFFLFIVPSSVGVTAGGEREEQGWDLGLQASPWLQCET